MFRFFESLLRPTAIAPDSPPPVDGDRRGLLRFYLHFIRQARGLLLALFGAGLVVALLDVTIPVMIGHVVELVGRAAPETFWHDQGIVLLGMAGVMLVLRPAALALRVMLTNQSINVGLTNLVRWQNHWHVVRQSWGFFQNDFAGRIANRVMQTGPSLRESVVSTTNAVWYIVVYGSSAMILLAHIDGRLAAPMLVWFTLYVLMLRYFVPRMRDRSRATSEARSALTGRIVDSYTNILTVKLFARARDEDDFVREAVDAHTAFFRHQLRMTTRYILTLNLLNAWLILATGAMALWLWQAGEIGVGTVAMALPLAWQIANMAGWVGDNVTTIFENVGVVQEGMRSIAVERQMPDRPDARDLTVTQGEIRFERLSFGYGTARGVLHDLDLTIRSGERVGLVGHSGAGKSTLVNLLLHFHRPEAGRILIDGQDIAEMTQESLRTRIAMVTQDTSLLHRSIRDNIRYGRPWASEAEIRAAADQAEATDFIALLEDWNGRRGFDAHVGERGVKLSGGQRQRIAIARVILKDAPILVLDEATSALDSEVEAAIQGQLETLMRGRTVIAIAHRLSTIARMDRLVVLDHGRIAEQGTHADLLAAGGPYARMWLRQSGGFAPATGPCGMPRRDQPAGMGRGVCST
jgi:ATP-binding cassette subfamily B multidrug efflux pump